MAKSCRFVYLDRTGEESAIYTETLQKSGAAQAEAAYIKHMFATPEIRHSLNNTNNITNADKILDDFQTKLDRKKDDSAYVDPNSRKSYEAVTYKIKKAQKINKKTKKGSLESILGSAMVEDQRADESNSKYRLRMAENKWADTAAHRDPKLRDSSPEEKKAFLKKKRRDAADKDKEAQDYIKGWVKYTFDSWDTMNAYGIYFHGAIAIALNQIQEWRAEQSKLTKKELDKLGVLSNVNEFITYEIDFREIAKELDGEGLVGSISYTRSAEYKKILKTIMAEIQSVETQWKLPPNTLKVRTEQRISNDAMNAAGTMDIFVYNPYNMDTIIYDIKTKTGDTEGGRGSMDTFWHMTSQKLGGVFSGEDANSANTSTAQVSYYQAMAQKAGFKVKAAKVILVQSNHYINTKTTGNPPGEQEHMMGETTLKKEDIQLLTTKPREVFQYYSDIDWDVELIKRRKNGFYGLLDEWSQGKILNLRGTQVSKNNFIRNKYDRLRKDKDGNYEYKDLNPDSDTYSNFIKLTPEEYSNRAAIEKIFAEEWDAFMKARKNTTTKVISYFNADGKGMHGLGNKVQNVAKLFNGYNNKEWRLYVAEEYDPDLYGDLGPDLIIAVHVNGKTVSFFSAVPTVNAILKFDQDGSKSKKGKRNNIFGNFATDIQIETSKDIPADIKELHAREHDLLTLKLAVAALRYKKENPEMNVAGLKVASIVGTDFANSSTVSSMEMEIYKLEKFRELMGKEEWDKNATLKELGKLLDDRKIGDFKNYNNNSLHQLLELIVEEGTPGGLLNQYNIKSKETAKDAAKEIEAFNRGKKKYTDLIKALIKLKKQMYQVADVAKAKAALDPHMKAVDAALRQILEVQKNTTQFAANKNQQFLHIKTGETINDYYIGKAAGFIRRFDTSFQEEFKEFERQHAKRLKDMFDEAGVTMGGPGSTKVFKQLYATWNDAEGDKSLWKEGKEDEWMTLKDPSHSFFNNRSKAKAYVEFFNAQVKKGLIRSQTATIIAKALEEGEYITKNRVPISKSTRISIKRGNLFKQYIERLKKGIKPSEKESEDNEKYAIKSSYEDEITDRGIQGSQKRRGNMGIGGDVADTYQKNEIEIRLDLILIDTVMEGMRTEHHGMIVGAVDVLDNTLIDIMDEYPELWRAAETRKWLNNYIHMLIHNRHKKEWLAKLTDPMGRLSSQLLFFGAFRQNATEFSTSLVQGLASSVASEIMTIMGADPWWRLKDWTWASRVWLKSADAQSQYQVLVEQMGVLYTDEFEMKNRAYMRQMQDRLLMSRLGYGINQYAINNGRKQAALAYAHQHGFHAAYEKITDEFGDKWEYREELDTRFYIYFEKDAPAWAKNNKNVHTKPPSTSKELEAYTRWEHQKEQMWKEDGINEESLRIIRPLSAIQRSRVGAYTTRIFGSMSKDGKIMGDTLAIFRLMGRMKKWFTQKVDAYWMPKGMRQTYTSEIYYPPLIDPETGEEIAPARVVEKVEEYQGIIQTMWDMARKTYELGLKSMWGDLGQMDKENLARLIADLLLLTLLSQIARLFFGAMRDWTGEDDNIMAGTLERSFGNAWKELFFFTTAYQMTDNMFPPVSIFVMLIERLLKAHVVSLQTPEKAVEQFKMFPRSIGLWNNYLMIDSLTPQ